jgi:hypothetical protein
MCLRFLFVYRSGFGTNMSVFIGQVKHLRPVFCLPEYHCGASLRGTFLCFMSDLFLNVLFRTVLFVFSEGILNVVRLWWVLGKVVVPLISYFPWVLVLASHGFTNRVVFQKRNPRGCRRIAVLAHSSSGESKESHLSLRVDTVVRVWDVSLCAYTILHDNKLRFNVAGLQK